MKYLPLFDAGRVQLGGQTNIRHEPMMLEKEAVFLSKPCDNLMFNAHGRMLGIVFFRHAWSGSVIVWVNEVAHRIELYNPEPLHWVFEIALPVSSAATIKVEADIKPDSSQGTEAWIEAVYVSDYLTNEVPELIAQHVAAQPLKGIQINQLTDVFKWYDATWHEVLKRLDCSPDYIPPDFVHRKAWEWAQCIYGLEILGAIRPEHHALGVGVGWEPLSYFLSNLVGQVIATDLYSVNNQWSEAGAQEGNPEILENPDKFAPYAYRRDRLKFMRMDGKKLEFPDATFDFIWSCSSIEHFGGHAGAAESMREIERVLKPGGVVAMITEYILPDPDTHQHTLFDAEYFNMRHLYEYIIRPVPGLRLVQNVDWSLPDYYVRRACYLPEEAGAPHKGSTKPHIVLHSPSGAIHTSISLFFRKEF